MQQELHQKQPTLSLLNSEEINNPQMVLTELFDFAHLPELKNMLWEWLKATVSGSYNKTLSNRERASILHYYEYLEKLLEANYLIHAQQKKAEAEKLDAQKHIF